MAPTAKRPNIPPAPAPLPEATQVDILRTRQGDVGTNNEIAAAPIDPDVEAASARYGEILLEHYRLEEFIGSGGLGVVFRAVDIRTGVTVAVKIMREELMRVRTVAARFLREARITRTMSHPAVPRGLASGVDRTGAPVLIMEYIVGENFGTILDRQGALPIAEALSIGARIAGALETAHRLGIIHRDIKPENVMRVTGSNAADEVMVLDFGIAFCLDEPRLSSANAMIGSPAYMSPEQARGDVVSPAADLYSLGATLVHLLTGRTVYAGEYLLQLAAHTGAPIPSIRDRRPEVPEVVDLYIQSLLQKDPAMRPVGAADVASALDELARICVGTGTADGVARREIDAVIFSAAMDPQDTLVEQLQAYTAQLHSVSRAAASAQARLVKQLVEISARRIERDSLEMDRALALDAGAHNEVLQLNERLNKLGDAEADRSRESALEDTLARMQSHTRSQQSEIRGHIRAMNAEIIANLSRQRGG